MKIGLIDVDGHHYPNLPLMKLSAWHKAQGDKVEWYEPLLSGHVNRVYMAKVFSFSEDYAYPVDADQIILGGSGYHIRLQDGKEIWTGEDINLPAEIEHIYPDYELYGIQSRAFGFLSRGCPRKCQFCHVKSKEGTKAYKVADLDEFWKGQKEIEIMDPNILAVPESEDLLQQLADSKAMVEINQGLDIRLLTEKKLEIIKRIRVKSFHFAWDNPADEENILPNLRMFMETVGRNLHNTICYVLVNFNSTIKEDLHRIYTLRDLRVQPYVMIYDKAHADRQHRNLQRWVNNPIIFHTVSRFEDYNRSKG